MALQKAFRGLQQFIGLYNEGQYRLTPTETLQPTVDVQDYAEDWITARATGTVSPGGSVAVVVPEGEKWRVKFAGVHCPNGVGESCLLSIEYEPKVLGQSWSMTRNDDLIISPIAPTGELVGVGTFTQNMILEPGDFVRGRLLAIGGGTNRLLRTIAQYQRIPI